MASASRDTDVQPDYRSALDHLLEGFQIIGFDWTYLYVNPAAARHGRRTVRELTGRTMMEAYPGIEQTPLFMVLRECLEERTSHVLENQFTYPDGESRWFEIRIQPVPEGMCIYSADIHARKEALLALEQRAEHLQARLSGFDRVWRLFTGAAPPEGPEALRR